MAKGMGFKDINTELRYAKRLFLQDDGDKRYSIGIEAIWYLDEDNPSDLFDLRIIPDQDICSEGVFISTEDWPKLKEAVDEVVAKTKKYIQATKRVK